MPLILLYWGPLTSNELGGIVTSNELIITFFKVLESSHELIVTFF
jgi:hypothetical protein